MELKQVELIADDGTATYAQPEVFNGVLVLALQHESGRVERYDLEHPRVVRLAKANPDVAAVLDDARQQAASEGVKTTSTPGPDTDAIVAALKKAGLVVTAAEPASQPAG